MSTATLTCPAWCTLQGHPVHRTALPEDDHTGPTFGLVRIEGRNEPDGSVSVSAATIPVAMLDPASLRLLADNAAQAAAWLKANR